jgi:hypothetical protein
MGYQFSVPAAFSLVGEVIVLNPIMTRVPMVMWLEMEKVE